LIFILENGRANHRDISSSTGIGSSTLSYYLNSLVKDGILKKESAGRERYYEVKNPEVVAKTIIRYRKSFLDSVVDNFVKLWEEKRKKK
jgi:sugar-specific transcriptional regulator TrmB